MSGRGGIMATDEIINLIKIGSVTDTLCVMSTLGANNQGKQYWVDGTSLKEAQQKTKLNQDPLFNVQDPDHVSFSDSTKYSSTTFAGNKLFLEMSSLINSITAILISSTEFPVAVVAPLM